MNKHIKEKKEKRTHWHRLIGLILRPLFTAFGFETEIEVDLSIKEQLVDIIVVRKNKTPKHSGLPKEYWEIFNNFNEHNLISFKSYSESFNVKSILEVTHYLISYCKVYRVNPDKVNLYAIIHHYPKKLLRAYEGTPFLTVIKKNEIIDLDLESIFSIRFIITQETEHPILALFSGKKRKVFESYSKLENTWLLDNISKYFDKILSYYGEEFKNMYTEKDFFRDYPASNQHFAFPWEEKYHLQQLEKVQKQAREALQKVEAVKEKEEKEKEKAAKEKEKAAKEKALLLAKKERKAKEFALAEIEILKKRLNDVKTI